MIKDNISRIYGQIEAICSKLGKDPSKIVLVGVTKFADVDQINEAIAAGLTHIGENKVQEAKRKFSLIENDSNVTRHMIGHLQTNKVKQALKIFDLIQSVDSFKLAEEIQRQAKSLQRNIDVLIQVNTSGEEQKFGIKRNEALNFIEEVANFKNIFVRGLMTMAPLTDSKDIIRRCFRDLRVLFDQISDKFVNDEHIEMKHLSMGMSADYEIALEEGSNMVRIGSAIFQGNR